MSSPPSPTSQASYRSATMSPTRSLHAHSTPSSPHPHPHPHPSQSHPPPLHHRQSSSVTSPVDNDTPRINNKPTHKKNLTAPGIPSITSPYQESNVSASPPLVALSASASLSHLPMHSILHPSTHPQHPTHAHSNSLPSSPTKSRFSQPFPDDDDRMSTASAPVTHHDEIHHGYYGGAIQGSNSPPYLPPGILHGAAHAHTYDSHTDEHTHPDTPGSGTSEDLGILLLEFLDFYGRQFDFQTMGIRIHPHGCFFYLSESARTLVISDPFQPENNIGKSVFAMWRIKAAFEEALHILCSRFSQANAPTTLSRILSGPHVTPVQNDSHHAHNQQNGPVTILAHGVVHPTTHGHQPKSVPVPVPTDA